MSNFWGANHIYCSEGLFHIFYLVETVFADGCVLELLEVFVVSTESTTHMILFQQNTVFFVEYFDAVTKIQIVLITDRLWNYNTAELVNF